MILSGLLAGLGEGLDPTDAVIRTLVASGITAIVAFAVYRLHVDWRRQEVDDAAFHGSAASRVFQAVAYTAVLIFVVLFALALVKAGYGVCGRWRPARSAAFAISETAEQEQGIADIVAGAALAAGAGGPPHRLEARGDWRGESAPSPEAPRIPRARPGQVLRALALMREGASDVPAPERVPDLGQQLDLGRAGLLPS